MSERASFAVVLCLLLATGSVLATDLSPTSSPDRIWISSPASLKGTAETATRLFTLDQNRLQEIVTLAPMEYTEAAANTTVTMTLPMPDGSFHVFRIEESPIMEAALAALHPEIKTYRGRSVTDDSITARFDRTPLGFHALAMTPDGAVFIEPAASGIEGEYVSYRLSDVGTGEGFACFVTSSSGDAPSDTVPRIAPSGTNLRTYRLAVAATGEYTQFFGGQAQALAAIATTVNNVNAIYNVEIATQLNLVANNNVIVFPDPATDDFPLADMNEEVQDSIDNHIQNANYDIGHLFHRDAPPADISGDAGCIGCICRTGSKGSGWSQSSNPQGGRFTFLVAHEMGHQHGANHSWNGTCTPELSPARYEPGSGTTIMSYSGVCGADNIQGNDVGDVYFHAGSRAQIVTYTGSGNGSTCGTVAATGNGVPAVSAGSDYTIPQSTPFVLTATGSDPDGEALTYCWEEYDLGNKAALNAVDNGNIPLFRSFPPVASPSRTFPRYADLLANNLFPAQLGEQLPSTNRTLRFRVTARDNRAGAGAADDDEVVLTVSGSPFDITHPDGGDTLECGLSNGVTWTVGGGSVAPTVDIVASVDGGATFSTLASNTPNDGAEQVTAPQALTSDARVRINAVGNVFFTISDGPVSIVDTTAPQIVCPPDVTAECTGNCGIEKTDPQLVDFFAAVAASDACSSSLLITNDAPDFLPLGDNPVTFTATDPSGNSAACIATIRVVDTTPPEIRVELDRDVLWPPNHKLVTINATVGVTDVCDPNATFRLTSVTSDEPDNGLGDGDMPNDIQDATNGTADSTIRLRSERSGLGDGRIYTIRYTAYDKSGNETPAIATVRVPHDRRGGANGSGGFNATGTGFVPGASTYRLVILSSALFDARRIDAADAMVGNHVGVVRAQGWRHVDANRDGLVDLELTYPVNRTLALKNRSTLEGPVGLHYDVGPDLEDYWVPNIFELGMPLPVVK